VPGSPTSAVDVRGLVVDRGGHRAVDGVDLVAHTGGITVLLGPNGAGKTSTVEHLEGYLPRAAGTVSVLGRDPARATDRRALHRRVGIMLQRGGIQGAIRPAEVLAQYASFFPDPLGTEELLDRVGLHDVRRTAVRRLSGGEQQRLSLALALVGRPELVFLDEPTAGVDLSGRDLIRTLVRELSGAGTTVVLTTHDLTEAEQLADHVVIVDRGTVVADGSPEELTSASGTDLRFRAGPGLATDSLARAAGCRVAEVAPGEYLVEGEPTPALVARVTSWLAEQDQAIGDLRAGRQRLEDVFRRLTAEAVSERGTER
jgi:ABC-2 type transport system ATP-binding protein